MAAAMLVASIDSRSGTLTLAPVADMALPAGRVAELWLIPAGGAPQSLGVIDPVQAGTLTIPAALRAGVGADTLLAISVEPPGGSPTGQPIGPVVAKGTMRGLGRRLVPAPSLPPPEARAGTLQRPG